MKEKLLLEVKKLRQLKKGDFKIFFNKVFLIPQKACYQLMYINFLSFLHNYLSNHYNASFSYFDYFNKRIDKEIIKIFIENKFERYPSLSSLVELYQENKKLEFVLNNYKKDTLFLFIDFVKKQYNDGKEFLLVEENKKIYFSSDYKTAIEKITLEDYKAVDLYFIYLNYEQNNNTNKKVLAELDILVPASFYKLDQLNYRIQLKSPHLFNLYFLLDFQDLKYLNQAELKEKRTMNFKKIEDETDSKNFEKERNEMFLIYANSAKEILQKLRD